MTTPDWEELSSAITGSLIREPDRLGRYQRDASHLEGAAVAAVAPRDAEDVVQLVDWARKFHVPLVARGGGTSLDGESVPGPGSMVVDFGPLDALLEIDPENRLARIQPGIVNYDLHRALVEKGWFFPPNPGSWRSCTLGGNAGTNASGPRSFRYGATRRWIRSANVVLGTGESIVAGHCSPKRSAGPELLDWLVGSEGTLGLFTELTIALAPLPEVRVGVVVSVPEDLALGPLVMGLIRDRRLHLAAIEYIDRRSASEMRRRAGSRLPADRELVLLELESTHREEEVCMEATIETLHHLGIVEEPLAFPDADELWTLRGQSGVALDSALGPRVREDIGVPRDRLDALRVGIRRIAEFHEVDVYVYGHLGDGNLHPNFVVDPGSPRADAIRSDLWQLARELGGTIAAEHGVGRIKASSMWREHSAPALRVMSAVKHVLDPEAILNPGKLYPADPGRGGWPHESSPGASGADRIPPR